MFACGVNLEHLSCGLNLCYSLLYDCSFMAHQLDDQALITHILARDRKALAAFYRRFAPRLAAIIRSKIDNPADAEEVLQDTLFAFLEAIRDFHGKSRLTTFLFSICHHKIVDYYRRKKIKQLVFSRMPNLEALISPVLNPEEELDATILKEKIHAVLNTIVPQYRRLLVCKYIDDLS